MTSDLKNVPILVESPGGVFHKVGQADVTRTDTLVVYFNGRKATRHPEGNFWEGPVGHGEGRTFEFRVPLSEVTNESLTSAPVPSDLTLVSKTYHGPKGKSGDAFIFSSTALQSSNVAFGASLIDLTVAEQTLEDLESRVGVLSASTFRHAAQGKAVAMWITHDASTVT